MHESHWRACIICHILSKLATITNAVVAAVAGVAVVGMFANQILSPHVLPQKIVGFSHAFRVEAGGRGTDSKGLYRVVCPLLL